MNSELPLNESRTNSPSSLSDIEIAPNLAANLTNAESAMFNQAYYANGFTSAGLTLNGGAAASGVLVLTDGPGQGRSAWLSSQVPVTAFESDFEFQLLDAVADGFTFTIQNAGPKAMGIRGGGLCSEGLKHSVSIKFDLHNNAGEGVNSTGLYLYGAAPTRNAIDLTPSGVDLHSGHVMQAQITYQSTTLSLLLTDTETQAKFAHTFHVDLPGVIGGGKAYVGFTASTGREGAIQHILSWVYSSGSAPASPVLKPAGGTFNTAQSVAITDDSGSAAIYYTTDGSVPSASSALYTGPITVSSSETIRAIAVESGVGNSGVASATYTISNRPAPPVPEYSHIVLVMLENHDLSQIIGSSQAPYINSLADTGALLTDYVAITHPSEPNYYALYAGSTFGVKDDARHSESGPTLATILQNAGKSFAGFIETGSPFKHNPWESFPEGTSVEKNLTDFAPDANLPNVAFVIPNLKDDMHNGTIAQADTWLKDHLDAYAQWAKQNNSLLIVTWDENDGSAGNRVPAILYGAHINQGRYNESYNHYYMLNTMLTANGLTAPNEAGKAKPIGSGVFASEQ